MHAHGVWSVLRPLVRAGGQLQARSALLSACILRMHSHAATAPGGANDIFRNAPEDGAVYVCTGDWLDVLNCAALVQAIVALPCSDSTAMVRHPTPLPPLPCLSVFRSVDMHLPRLLTAASSPSEVLVLEAVAARAVYSSRGIAAVPHVCPILVPCNVLSNVCAAGTEPA